MPHPRHTNEQLAAFAALLRPHRKLDGTYSYHKLAKELHESSGTWQHRAEAVMAAEAIGVGFDVPPLPEEIPSADELRERRKAEYNRTQIARTARKLIPVNVRVDGPYGIVHFGDCHLDDPGTDMALIEKHVGIVSKTPALFAGNIGDLNNNWIGRLVQLHAEQTTTAREAWVLVEWLMAAMPWLYVVLGNHDAWSGDRDPLDYILRNTKGVKGAWGTRLELRSPNGAKTRINARHDFRGKSQWSTVHGPVKAAKLGWRDHILVCGDHHTSGYALEKDPATGLISHIIRVAGYKVVDDFAEQHNLPDQAAFSSCVTIIDPRKADDDVGRVTFFADVEMGADVLTWLRKKVGDGSR